jgi:hypothetical protein
MARAVGWSPGMHNQPRQGRPDLRVRTGPIASPPPGSRNPGRGVWKRPVHNPAMPVPSVSVRMRWLLPQGGCLDIHAVGNEDKTGPGPFRQQTATQLSNR